MPSVSPPSPVQLPALWLVRHGQSAGNVARDRAEASGAATIELEGRDLDVPLSALGTRQSIALGRWFAKLPAAERPTLVISSPFARAMQTAQIVSDALAGSPVPLTHDERLREKEFGSLNRLTRAGIVARFPLEAEQRALIGKFYYRPPGGESWCDVALRLRALFDHLRLFHAGERVLLVAHQVIVLCARYIIEALTEHDLLAIDRQGDVANCAITSYVRRGAGLALTAYNVVAPLDAEGAAVTDEPDTAACRA
ncbi:MAG TPA: histidine phosphatase family protein [Kofleriaceae bacterium]|nr:histidine phosphatase family protein [Kofleriaceae bacterium]